MKKYKGVDFYTRTVDVLVNHLPDLSNSELKLALIISKVTVGANLRTVKISLNDFEALSGLSRKTVIESLSSLKRVELIDKDESQTPHAYSIGRLKVQKLSEIESKPSLLYNRIESKHHMVEKLNLESRNIPSDIKYLMDLWNRHFHKRLETDNEVHLKYIQTFIDTFSYDTALKILLRCIDSGDWCDGVITENELNSFFEDKGG